MSGLKSRLKARKKAKKEKQEMFPVNLYDDEMDKMDETEEPEKPKKQSVSEKLNQKITDLMQKKQTEATLSYKNMPWLKSIKPREKYVFHSDYFQVDNYYAVILSFFHNSAATDGFAPFWGLGLIPTGLPQGVTTINFEQVNRMGEKWVMQHQESAESVNRKNETEQLRSGSNSARIKASRAAEDLEQIAAELNDGASYLRVQNRLMVKAPSLEILDQSVQMIERLYSDRFGSLWIAPYQGEQRTELSTLFSKNELKKGKGFYYTSAEYAGSYSLVTHGLEDPDGEYVGDMVGDVNASAVLFAVNRYKRHIVVATEQHSAQNSRIKASNMWGSKIAQSALAEGNRVVHFILDQSSMDDVGPEFKDMTVTIDMERGDINVMEVFGDIKDELALFSFQVQKIINLAEQAGQPEENARTVLRMNLESALTEFYINQKMWQKNAPQFRERLRLVGIPHDQVPRLEQFVNVLSNMHKSALQEHARDEIKISALNTLKALFSNLLHNNGDLFNTTTNDAVDAARTGRRVIYDFSNLSIRGSGIAMAQFVNVIGFAVQNLGAGDTILFHGAENIDSGIRDYLNTQLQQFYNRNGRVAFLYGDIDAVLRDAEFNHFDTADYTIFGNMSENQVKEYQRKLGESLPPDMETIISDKTNSRCYIRRGINNVIFEENLILFPSKNRKR